MHFSDPVGNCNLTSISFFRFAERILKIAEDICEGKLAFILEGGYSLIALPFCVHAVLKALLNEKYEQPLFEKIEFLEESNREKIIKIKSTLKNLLKSYWKL
jgi:acetoin utilization deacetylase AcuC-like enzyme